MFCGLPRLHQHRPCVRVGDILRGLLVALAASLDESLAAEQASYALLAVLHDDVEVVVCDQVLNYSDSALLSLTEVLQRHGPFDLHHDTLLEVCTALSKILELLYEEQRMGVFVLSDVGFDWWE